MGWRRENCRLINRFVLLRPEIIDIRVSDVETDRQIGRIFGVQVSGYNNPLLNYRQNCFKKKLNYERRYFYLVKCVNSVPKFLFFFYLTLSPDKWFGQGEPADAGDVVDARANCVQNILDVLVVEGLEAIVGHLGDRFEVAFDGFPQLLLVTMAVLNPPAGGRRIEGHIIFVHGPIHSAMDEYGRWVCWHTHDIIATQQQMWANVR